MYADFPAKFTKYTCISAFLVTAHANLRCQWPAGPAAPGRAVRRTFLVLAIGWSVTPRRIGMPQWGPDEHVTPVQNSPDVVPGAEFAAGQLLFCLRNAGPRFNPSNFQYCERHGDSIESEAWLHWRWAACRGGANRKDCRTHFDGEPFSFEGQQHESPVSVKIWDCRSSTKAVWCFSIESNKAEAQFFSSMDAWRC